MKILTDPDEYLKTKAWADKTVDELGVTGAEKLLKAIRARTDDCRSRSQQAALVDKLEGSSACLMLAINDRRLKDFMAPGREAVKRMEKYGREQSNKRRRRTEAERARLAARNEAMIEHFKRTKLTRNGFCIKHAAAYGLKWRRAMDILPK